MDGFPTGSIWPASGDEEIQSREVYARYGLAMFMAQVLEHAMVNAIIVMRTLPAIRSHPNASSWQAKFDTDYEAGFANTYGNMVRELGKIADFPTGLLERLKQAKTERDDLAHRFFRQNDLAFMNPRGRTHMIAICEQRIELFKALADEVDALLGPIQERHGITQQWVDEAYAKSLKEAENWSPEDPKRP